MQTIQKDSAGHARGYVLEDGVVVAFPADASGQLAAIVAGTQIQVGVVSKARPSKPTR